MFFEYEAGNRCVKALIVYSILGVFLVAFGGSKLLLSPWPWIVFALLVYFTEVENLYIFAQRNNIDLSAALVMRWQKRYKVKDHSLGAKVGIVATIAFMPLFTALQVVVIGGVASMILSVIFKTFGIVFSVLPEGRY